VTDEEKPAQASIRPPIRGGWVTTAALIIFGLVYAYDLFAAISSLVQVPGEVAANNEFYKLNEAVPWGALVAAVALPPVVFGVTVLMGRRRNLGSKVLLLTAGLALVAAVTLSLTALARAGIL
jgi:hypothetical protein